MPPYIPPQPPSKGFFEPFQPPPRLYSSFGNFHIPAQLSAASFHNQGLSGNLFGSQTQTLTRENEKVQDSVWKELDNTIYELPNPPKLELANGLLNSLGVQVNDIFEQKFIKKQQEDAVPEQIKEDYNFHEIKDGLDEGAIPHQLDFFYGGENSNFNQAIEFLLQSNENRHFIAFLLSDQGELKVEIFPIKILILLKIFAILFLHKKTIRQLQYVKDFHTITVLESTYRIFYPVFQLIILKNLIYMPIKMQNIYSINSMTILKGLVEKHKLSSIS